MYAVEFEAQITNGHIVVPEELRQRLSGSLRVLVLVEADNGFSSAAYQGGGTDIHNTDSDARLEKRQPGESLLAYRLRNPYQVADFQPLSREEVHERRAEYKSE